MSKQPITIKFGDYEGFEDSFWAIIKTEKLLQVRVDIIDIEKKQIIKYATSPSVCWVRLEGDTKNIQYRGAKNVE